MTRYENVINRLEIGKLYSHKELVSKFKQVQTGLSESAYCNSINTLMRQGKITRNGYNTYSLSDGTNVRDYKPFYSNDVLNLIRLVGDKYPNIAFTVFETVMLNDFLNHLIAQNTIFIQVEKESSIYVFRFLQESGYKNVMYKPNKKEFALYWSKDCVVVTDMISESPLRLHEPHTMVLEKLLVDMYSDKLISSQYERSEFVDIIEQAKKQYRLDKTKMLRYARRRNKENELLKFL